MIEQNAIPVQSFHTACGEVITNPDDYPSAIHNGKRVYFCTAACLEAFQTDPKHCMADTLEFLED